MSVNEDNDPKHTTSNMRHRPLYNTPPQLHSPPQSPDINAIEHTRSILEIRVDDTLATIRASDCGAIRSEESWIFPRDPSIIAFNQRPLLPIAEPKKNLYSLYEDGESDAVEQSSQDPTVSVMADTIKVYLRMKPLPPKLRLTKQQEEAYQIIDSTTLLTRLPSLDKNTSALKKSKGNEFICRKFMFTRTFDSQTTQLELFDSAVKQHLIDFINGRSSTVMSFGTTNAGKSYTLQGTTSSPGIIPRGLEFVFNTITPRANPCFKPVYNNDVKSLDANERAYEIQLKTKLLSFGSIEKNQYVHAYKSMQKLLQEESLHKPNETSSARYSVWVSFAEIYNETIYDLLCTDYQKKRPSLKLASDSHGKAFIRGLKTICVSSGSEAYQVLMVGQDNLKVAATALNAKSSRSHCIFTIKLLKYYHENSPANVQVSTLSFCDLAGSERLKKTLNAGERLKEAQNINTSLLVLGRCLKSIWELQTSRLTHEITGPFRESKLTRLFQNALSGKEQIALIVNVNPVPNLYAETQNVLNFSAIAKQIFVEPAVPSRRKSSSKFSKMVSHSVKTTTDWDMTELDSVAEESSQSMDKSEYVHIEDYDEVMAENKELKKKLAELKTAAIHTDYEIRQELSAVYSNMIKNLETTYKNRLQNAEEQQQDMLTWSINHLESVYEAKLRKVKSNRKRSRIESDEGSSDEEVCIEDLEIENHQLKSKVTSLKETIKELRDQKEKLYIDNNRNAFELSLARKDLENYITLLKAAQSDVVAGNGADELVKELQEQLEARDKANKGLKVYLNEAKEEWIKSSAQEGLLIDQLKEKEVQLIEASENNTDLTEQLEHANVCLAENTKTIESLEEKLECYMKQLAEAEEKVQTAEDKCSKTHANNLVLLKDKEEMQRLLDAQETKESIEQSAEDMKKLMEELARANNEIEKLKNQITEQEETLVMLNSKLTDAEDENAKSKTALARSNNENEFLHAKLQSTNSAFADIKEQINLLRIADATEVVRVDVDSQTSFVNDEELVEENPAPAMDSLKLVQDQLDLVSAEKTGMEMELNEKQRFICDLESKVTEYEAAIKKLQIELESKQQDVEHKTEILDENLKTISTLEDQLSTVNSKLEVISTECSANHVTRIEILEKDVSAAKEREDLNTQILESHINRIATLEKDLAESRELGKEIEMLRNDLEKCKEDKINLEKQLEENREELLSLQNKLEASVSREHEKDTEISSLQKEVKTLIYSNSKPDADMEKEMKLTLKKWTEAQEKLASTESALESLKKSSEAEIEKLQIRLNTFEQNATYVALLQEGAESRQAENERLRRLNEELQKKADQNRLEMESFNKNREEMMQRYEGLVKQLQEDAERNKREVTRYQEVFLRQSTPTPRKEEIRRLKDELRSKTNLIEQLQENIKKHESSKEIKDNDHNSSEEEHVEKDVRPTRRRAKANITQATPANDEIAIIEISGSESKRSTRRTALPPPQTAPVTEKRRLRKKKLFTADDDVMVDIEPTEGHSLRNRKPRQ